MKSFTRRWVVGVVTFLVLFSATVFICGVDHGRLEGCKESCTPYQVRDCPYSGSVVLCYTDKPGLFAERPRK